VGKHLRREGRSTPATRATLRSWGLGCCWCWWQRWSQGRGQNPSQHRGIPTPGLQRPRLSTGETAQEPGGRCLLLSPPPLRVLRIRAPVYPGMHRKEKAPPPPISQHPRASLGSMLGRSTRASCLAGSIESQELRNLLGSIQPLPPEKQVGCGIWNKMGIKIVVKKDVEREQGRAWRRWLRAWQPAPPRTCGHGPNFRLPNAEEPKQTDGVSCGLVHTGIPCHRVTLQNV